MPGAEIYFSPVVPGVVFTSSGAEGLIRPRRFSGVLDCTLVGPGPAVAGLSPLGSERLYSMFGISHRLLVGSLVCSLIFGCHGYLSGSYSIGVGGKGGSCLSLWVLWLFQLVAVNCF